jgi:hypothetical protein
MEQKLFTVFLIITAVNYYLVTIKSCMRIGSLRITGDFFTRSKSQDFLTWMKNKKKFLGYLLLQFCINIPEKPKFRKLCYLLMNS